jgi:RNA polymerase sigma factor (sigma-70 family)
VKRFSSEQLLKYIQSDDYERYLAMIYQLVYPMAKKLKSRFSVNNLELDDIIQDSVIRFYRTAKEGKIDPIGNVEGYVYVLVKNVILASIKKNKIETNQLTEEFDQLEDLNVNEVESRAEILEQAISRLSDSCRNIIDSFYFLNLSMKEIAQKFGYSNDDVVKTKHYKCKQRLSEIIEGDLIFKELLKS